MSHERRTQILEVEEEDMSIFDLPDDTPSRDNDHSTDSPPKTPENPSESLMNDGYPSSNPDDAIEYEDISCFKRVIVIEVEVNLIETTQVSSDKEDEPEYVEYSVDEYRVPPRGNAENPPRRRQSSSTPRRSDTSPRPSNATAKKPPPTPKATDADARKHWIPSGYSLKNWDPSEEPIMLLGSVFDANSIGKWIYDWSVYQHGPATEISDLAGELWLLLIQLAGKVKRAEACLPRVRTDENREMVEDFIETGERLTDKFKKLLKSCETPMLKAGNKHGKDPAQLAKNAGIEFVDSIFGRDRQLEATEEFMSSIRLWALRFDANCEDILRRPGQ
jgi:hypothetical protein